MLEGVPFKNLLAMTASIAKSRYCQNSLNEREVFFLKQKNKSILLIICKVVRAKFEALSEEIDNQLTIKW